MNATSSRRTKKRNSIATHILIILVLSVNGKDTLHCQDRSRDTTTAKIVELSRGCKLVLDAQIDTSDSLSIQIISGIREIVPRIQSLIPADSITIDLRVGGDVLPFLGVGARTTSEHSVLFNYDPKNPKFRTESIARGLVHECYHPVRLRMPHWQLTVLECMITEGLADHFMVQVLKCEQPVWSRALSEEEIRQNLLKAKPILFEKHKSWNDEFTQKFFAPWMFGRKGDDPIPGWTGYSLGWRIVDNYLKAHPEIQASSLVWTPAEVIAGATPELIDAK
jgi:hypothetical protein